MTLQLVQPAFVLVPPSEDEEDEHFVLLARMAGGVVVESRCRVGS